MRTPYLNKLQVFQQMRDRRGGDDHQAAFRVRGHLFQVHEQGLQHDIGKAGADRSILEDTLDVVNKNNGQARLISVHKHPLDGVALLPLGEPDHGVSREHADERELAVGC